MNKSTPHFFCPPDSDSSDASGCISCGRPVDHVTNLDLCTHCLDRRPLTSDVTKVTQMSPITSSLLTSSGKHTDFSISKITSTDSKPSKRLRPEDLHHHRSDVTTSRGQSTSPGTSPECNVKPPTSSLLSPVSRPSSSHHLPHPSMYRHFLSEQQHESWMTSQMRRSSDHAHLGRSMSHSSRGQGLDLRQSAFVTSLPPAVGLPTFLAPHHGALDLRGGQSYAPALAHIHGGYALAAAGVTGWPGQIIAQGF